MAKRPDAEFAQVSVGQRLKQAHVDVIVAEGLLVLAKLQAL
jgi:hypothetical protein